jgi:hypothetical protein
VKNPDLVRAFELLMARLGKPVTPITERKIGRGRPAQAYRFANGQTILLKTNQKPALLTLAKKNQKGSLITPSSPLALEDYDFVAAVFPDHPEHRNCAVVYMIPSEVAASELKKNQQTWIDINPKKHKTNNPLRLIRFDDPGEDFIWTDIYGYAAKWAEYRLGDIELSAAPSERPVETAKLPAAILERHRREIASEFGVKPEAVEISVKLSG